MIVMKCQNCGEEIALTDDVWIHLAARPTPCRDATPMRGIETDAWGRPVEAETGFERAATRRAMADYEAREHMDHEAHQAMIDRLFPPLGSED